MIGEVSVPYHDSFFISVEMESGFFDLILIGDTCARSNVRGDDVSGDDVSGDDVSGDDVSGDDVNGDERTRSIDVRFDAIALRDSRLACVTDRRGTSIPKQKNKFKRNKDDRVLLTGIRPHLKIINGQFHHSEGTDSLMMFRAKSVLYRPLFINGT
jgi:hypothetical protein